MKPKYPSNKPKTFNKHHHHEEFFLYMGINEKEAICPDCKHPLSRHKIRVPYHCTERLCKCNLSRIKAKTNYFKQFMKERKGQKTLSLDFTHSYLSGEYG